MSDLTARDIVLIMNRAAKLGVTSLTIGELDISFSNRGLPQEELSISQKPTKPQAQVEKPLDTIEVTGAEKEVEKLENYRKEQETFLNAPVLDPLGWEEQQISLLEDGVDDKGEVEDAEGIQV